MVQVPATQPRHPAPSVLPPLHGAPDSRRGARCAACGREVGRLEARHLIEGAAFHTVCVPSA